MKLWMHMLRDFSTMLMENGACHVDGHFKHPEQLFVAAYRGQSKYTKFLLQIGVDANMTEKGCSALSIAAWTGEVEVVKHLLDHHAEIDYQVPHSGTTALFAAASGSYSEVVRLLLERGANPNIKDKYGQTPLFIAIMQENDKVANILLDAGSNPNARDIYGRNPLMYAAAMGHQVFSNSLLQAGTDFDIADTTGRTPLLNAAAGGSLKLVQMLLDMKADPAQMDKYGRDAAYEASKRGHRDVARALLYNTGEENSSIKDTSLSGANDPKRSQGEKICDICTVGVPYGDHYFHCGICQGGDFDICRYCEESEVSCLVEGHKLTRECAN